jgi:hypothetical protein
MLCSTPSLPLSLYYLLYIKIYKKNAGERGQRGNEGRRTVKIISGISGHTIFENRNNIGTVCPDIPDIIPAVRGAS